jgi:hypothetical protein
LFVANESENRSFWIRGDVIYFSLAGNQGIFPVARVMREATMASLGFTIFFFSRLYLFRVFQVSFVDGITVIFFRRIELSIGQS